MLELHEVESVHRVLVPQLAGRVIEGVDALNGQVVAHPAPETFAGALAGWKIAGMGRRGKYFSAALDDGWKLVVRLRTTGWLLVVPPDAPVEKYTHLVLRLSDGAGSATSTRVGSGCSLRANLTRFRGAASSARSPTTPRSRWRT